MFKVSLELECPRYLETIVTGAPLLTKKDAQLCLKSCSLISLTPAFCAISPFLRWACLYVRGVRPLSLPNIKKSSLKFLYLETSS